MFRIVGCFTVPTAVFDQQKRRSWKEPFSKLAHLEEHVILKNTHFIELMLRCCAVSSYKVMWRIVSIQGSEERMRLLEVYNCCENFCCVISLPPLEQVKPSRKILWQVRLQHCVYADMPNQKFLFMLML